MKYLEKMVIYNGGIVERCCTCKKLTMLRFVNETRNMCPNSVHTWQDITSYEMCDECADERKRDFERENGEILDGRETAQTMRTQQTRYEKL